MQIAVCATLGNDAASSKDKPSGILDTDCLYLDERSTYSAAHDCNQFMPYTWSPGLTLVTDEPTSETMPAKSQPRITGRL